MGRGSGSGGGGGGEGKGVEGQVALPTRQALGCSANPSLRGLAGLPSFAAVATGRGGSSPVAAGLVVPGVVREVWRGGASAAFAPPARLPSLVTARPLWALGTGSCPQREVLKAGRKLKDADIFAPPNFLPAFCSHFALAELREGAGCRELGGESKELQRARGSHGRSRLVYLVRLQQLSSASW